MIEIEDLQSWKNESNSSKIHNFKVLLIYANSPMDNMMPVSISSVAGSLMRRGFDVKLFDTTFYPYTESGGERKGSLQVKEFDYESVGLKYKTTNVYDDLIQLVQEFQPNLIGMSTVEPTHLFGISLIKEVKKYFDIPVIVGGVHTIFSPEDLINTDVVDMACIAEGEKSMVELCERMANQEDYTSVLNVWVKKDGHVYKNAKSEIMNLEDLPFLDFSMYEDKRFYRPMSGTMYRMIPIEFSRGCPYKCTYCSAPGFDKEFKDQGKWLRHKPISHIYDEIMHYLDNYDVEYFYFVSETFLSMPKKFFEDFINMYSKIGIPFWFNTRPESIKEEKIKMIEDVGCHRISIGIECGNEEYRKKILKRPVSNERMLKACDILAKSSIEYSVNNIIGFPDETREMMFETIMLNRQIEADDYSCSIFQPFRGTELHTYCVEKGYFDANELSIDLTVGSPLKQNHITSDEIKGIERTFPLYIKLPESEFHRIKKAEKMDDEGNQIFEELSSAFKETCLV